MSVPTTSKPVPSPTPSTRPYWDGTARHELWIQQCVTTGKVFTYPRRFSPFVVGGEVAWVQASGRGRLYSYVINHFAGPGYKDEVPYVIAIVELEEGPRVIANLRGVEPVPDRLTLGMALEAVYEERESLTIVQFRPEEAS